MELDNILIILMSNCPVIQELSFFLLKLYVEEIDSLIREYEGKFERAQKEFEEKIGAVKSDAQRSHQRFTERISSLESTIYDLERKLAEQSSQAAQMSQELARSAETTALAVQEAKAKEVSDAFCVSLSS